MNREELIRKIDETILAISPDTNICEELADLIEQEKKDEVKKYMNYAYKGNVSEMALERWYNQFKEGCK